jgi:FMN phosphatase YigB (HAD superfamily)
MKEIACFDLDGTLVELKIDKDEFEACRSSWAAYLSSCGLPTTLRPLLPELRRLARTPLGCTMKADILRSFDQLELACRYCCLGNLDALLHTCRSRFRRLVLVTHNSTAFWTRLTREHSWPHLFDRVITRDQMTFFKPDARVCESVFQDLTPSSSPGECWVIGNSEADRGLGINLSRAYPHLVVRTIMVDPASASGPVSMEPLHIKVNHVDRVLDLLQETSP